MNLAKLASDSFGEPPNAGLHDTPSMKTSYNPILSKHQRSDLAINLESSETGNNT